MDAKMRIKSEEGSAAPRRRTALIAACTKQSSYSALAAFTTRPLMG